MGICALVTGIRYSMCALRKVATLSRRRHRPWVLHTTLAQGRRGAAYWKRGILPGSVLGVDGGRNDVHMVSLFPDGIVARKLLSVKAQELWWIDL